jgi:hypothetical protein
VHLYIANCTRQNQIIFYRLDFNADGMPRSQDGVQPKHQAIQPGKQAPIGGDLSHISQADSIVAQLRPFGCAAVSEINRLNKFTPYIFDVDKPVSADAIRKVFNHNQGILSRNGAEIREMSAIAASEAIVPHADGDKITIGIEQVSESEYGGPQVAEGFIIDKTAAPSKRRAGRPRNAA